MSIKLDRTATLKFVQAYKKHECLWKADHKFYKSKEARTRAYENIVEEMTFANLNLLDVKTKIRNLRSTYNQEVKKMQLFPNTKTTIVWFDLMTEVMEASASCHKPSERYIGHALETIESEGEESTPDHSNSNASYGDIKPDFEIKIEYPEEPIKGEAVEAKFFAETDPYNFSKSDQKFDEQEQDSLRDPISPNPVDLSKLHCTNPSKQSRVSGQNLAGEEISMITDQNIRRDLEIIKPKKRKMNAGASKASPSSDIRNPFLANIHESKVLSSSSLNLSPVDEFDMFGMNVALQLKNLPLAKALRTQIVIQEALAKARLADDS